MLELSEMRNDLLERVTAACQSGCEYRSSFEKYAYLWVDDRQEFLQQFLRYGHVVTAEELEQAGDEGVPEKAPTLVQFKQQVGHLFWAGEGGGGVVRLSRRPAIVGSSSLA